MSRRASSVLLCAVVVVAGCEYERVVYRRPMLSGLPGTTTGGEAVSERPRGYVDPSAVGPGTTTIENDDGTTTLVARSARHLMAHIYTTLRDDDRELFTEQVLSSVTKAEFRERGLDPREAFDRLKERQADIDVLFGRMPQGEYTPGMLMKKVGDKTYRLALSGRAGAGLYWSGFDMVMEHGSWRLRWFVQPGD